MCKCKDVLNRLDLYTVEMITIYVINVQEL